MAITYSSFFIFELKISKNADFEYIRTLNIQFFDMLEVIYEYFHIFSRKIFYTNISVRIFIQKYFYTKSAF